MNKNIFLILSILFLKSSLGFCDIKLPQLISDGAILQRDMEVTIWGWATPGEKVVLNYRNTSYTSETDQNGKWQISLPPQKAGGPFVMFFKGENEIVVSNILFGDVWLCSGQSNMELTMQRLKDRYPSVIENCANPHIRQFLVPDQYDFKKAHEDFESGRWQAASPENIFSFSGVAYFYAKALYDTYQVPIGLINAALGGSPVEAWISEDALKEFPEAYQEMQRFKDDKLIREIEKKDQSRQQNWYARLNAEDAGNKPGKEWFQKDLNDGHWEEMELPGFWANQNLGEVNGVVWFRKTVNLAKDMTGQEARLWLGRLVDQDHVYVNGIFVGSTGYRYPPRKYQVPEGLLKEGENTIAIRLISEQGQGGFVLDKPYFLAVGTDSFNLRGSWKYRLGTEMPPLEGPTFIRWKPGGLFNKMIAPLTSYKIKGVIWYQGESNTKNPSLYARTFPALIGNWRDKWQMGDLPFLYVQLANFMEETKGPVESEWAALRQAQLETLSIPNTGMAVTIDLGEWNDIHPLNKEDVGKRLAQLAYNKAYGEELSELSPLPVTCKFSKNKVAVRFSKKGLKSKDGEPLRLFELSGDGNTFHRALARIKGDQVIIWNEHITEPVAVRYAWSNNPARANLYSLEGLPASPFEIRK